MKNETIAEHLRVNGVEVRRGGVSRLDGQGLGGTVYRVETSGQLLLLKLYGRLAGDAPQKVSAVSAQLLQSGLPVPRVHLVGSIGRGPLKRPFVLMEHIRGTTWDTSREEGWENEFVARFAGSIHQLHSTPLGDTDVPQTTFAGLLGELRAMSLLLLPLCGSLRLLGRIRTILRSLSRRKVTGNPRAILHGDCHPGNALYRAGRVYLVDLDDALVGDPAFDVGYAYHMLRFEGPPASTKLADHFLRTYLQRGRDLADLETYARLAAVKLGIVLRILSGVNIPSILFVGPHKILPVLANKRHLRSFLGYCVRFAERGAEEPSWPPA